MLQLMHQVIASLCGSKKKQVAGKATRLQRSEQPLLGLLLWKKIASDSRLTQGSGSLRADSGNVLAFTQQGRVDTGCNHRPHAIAAGEKQGIEFGKIDERSANGVGKKLDG